MGHEIQFMEEQITYMEHLYLGKIYLLAVTYGLPLKSIRFFQIPLKMHFSKYLLKLYEQTKQHME